MTLILDTGVVLAATDRGDPQHRQCRDLLESASERLTIPAPTLCEIDYWFRKRVGPGATIALLREVQAGAVVVEDLAESDYVRVAEIMDRYDQIGFVDAAVLAVCERLGEPKLATLDRRHFGIVRPRHVEALQLLPA